MEVGETRDSMAERLVGRTLDLRLLQAFLARTAVDGEALLLAGEPGIGKTALLEAVAEEAERTGATLVRAAGVEFEPDVSFSGLNQLLFPLSDRLDALRPIHREALAAALGLDAGSSSDSRMSERFVVSNAALSLLRIAAAERRVFAIVDDVQWLDRPTALVLGFVSRRLSGSRIGLVATVRSEDAGFFVRGGIAEHEVQPLNEQEAVTLLTESHPHLATTVQNRVLREAEGNPLALLELPEQLSSQQQLAEDALPSVLPLGRRLRRLFASHVSGVPIDTRRLLLLAALEGSGDLRILERAADDVDLASLAPAEQLRLVRIDDRSQRIFFRHPIVRAAVVDLATSDERRRAHQLLADATTTSPERRASHLAEATVEPDEQVAQLLEESARSILRRGDAVGAVAALTRSAQLTPDSHLSSKRLAMAAYIGADVTGNLRAVSQLLADAGRADTHAGSSLPAAVAAAYFVLNEDGNIATAHALLAGAIEAALQDAHVDDGTLFEALHTLMLVCFFAERAELWRPFEKTLARLAPHVPLALALSARTFADPARADASVTARLDAAIRALPEESDPTKIVRIGMAAFYVDRLGGCRDALWRVVRDGREGGAVASSIDALLEIAFDDFATGDWAETHRLATEALKLCDASGYTLLAWPARLAFALLAAARGDGVAVQELASDMITWATPRGAGVVRSYAHHARALAAIGRGDFEDAYQQSVAISPAGVLASHTAHALCVVLELVEAAVRTGRTAEASAHVAALQQANIAALSPRLGLITAGASALAAPNDDGAFLLFEQAISSPDAARWAFDLARIQLAYGERLRRARATVESRRHLGAALETFERLGAEPWTGRARNELRATGQTRTQGQLKRIILTPQEREIASLAASGLTNKQIGAQLYLSARTVGAHLYRVFPKLGITSRAALRDALAAQDEPLANDPDA